MLVNCTGDENAQDCFGRIFYNMSSLVFVVFGAAVFFMKAGFAFLEGGAVREKNVVSILMKNLLDLGVVGFAWFSIGWALAFGTSYDIHTTSFAGTNGFFLGYVDGPRFGFLFYQMGFAAISTAIVSGAMAERTTLTSYLMYAFFYSGIIFPVAAHWVWGYGFFFAHSHDLAGSSVVHICGGASALAVIRIIGNRSGDWIEFKPHNKAFIVLGGFILFFGFIFFNAGSINKLDDWDDGSEMARVALNSLLCSQSSAVVGLILTQKTKFFEIKYWDISVAVNLYLVGFITACAGVKDMEPWACLIMGAVCPFFYLSLRTFVRDKLRLDDPIEAVAVHLGGGVWGMLSVIFFNHHRGMFYTGFTKGYELVLWQCLTIICVATWAYTMTSVFYIALKYGGKDPTEGHPKYIRLGAKKEKTGMDRLVYGGPCYEWGNTMVYSSAQEAFESNYGTARV